MYPSRDSPPYLYIHTVKKIFGGGGGGQKVHGVGAFTHHLPYITHVAPIELAAKQIELAMQQIELEGVFAVKLGVVRKVGRV